MNQSVALLLHRMVIAEKKPDGSGPDFRHFSRIWNALDHRAKGKYRRQLEAKLGLR